MGVVDPQVLDPEPADRVRGDVQREGPPVPELEAPVGPDDQQRDADAPQRLVQEGRVVRTGGATDRRVGVDLQRPGQIGLAPVQLLVEPVAPAADGLRDGEAGRERVGPGRERDAAAAAADPRAERAERHGAPDAESALPDLEGVHPVPTRAEVQLVVGDHVVEPSADEPEGHRPDGDVGDGPRRAAPGDPAPVADPDGDEDADDDAERVAAQRNRAEVNHAGRRAGNVSEVHDRDDATVPNGKHGNPPGATAA